MQYLWSTKAVVLVLYLSKRSECIYHSANWQIQIVIVYF